MLALLHVATNALARPHIACQHRIEPLKRTSSAAMSLSLRGFRRGGRDEQGPSEEMQLLYRMLGVTEDANYEEITAAYEDLSTKYAGQTKRLIKLQVAKDKILEERLRQRISG